MSLTLFHAPLACSLASRLALFESGVPHEVVVIHTTKGQQLQPVFLAVNPRGKVPALVTAEGVITESTAILPFIADLAPDKAQFPLAGTVARARAQSWLGFLSSTLHPAFTASMFPERFVSDPASAEAARDKALEAMGKALTDLDTHLKGRTCILESFSVVDLYALVFSLWRGSPALAGRLPVLANLDAFQAALAARPGLMPIVGQDIAARGAA